MGHVSTSTQRTLYFLSTSNYLASNSNRVVAAISSSQCRALTSNIPRRHGTQLTLRKYSQQHGYTQQQHVPLYRAVRTVPYLSYTHHGRCLHTDKPGPPPGPDLLPHVKPKAPQLDFTKRVPNIMLDQTTKSNIESKTADHIVTTEAVKSSDTIASDKKPGTSSSNETAKSSSAAEASSEKSKAVVRTAQVYVETLPLHTRLWNSTKNVFLHYKDGSRLLIIETQISARLFKKILDGTQLTRRERHQLVRTVKDLFRIVPLMFFLLIPFMELLLPVALFFFPNMLPSTFESIGKKKEKKLKKLKLKLDLAKFIQESMVSSMPLQKGQPTELKRFSEFIVSTRSKDPRDDIDELVSFSQLFSDHLTLDNLERRWIVALCQLLNLHTFSTESTLRFRLRNRMKELREDDIVIREEGLDNLTAQELQQANTDRGMRAVGVSKERLRLQLDQWLALRLEKDIPITLLLLSRVMTLPRGPVPSYEDLRGAVAHLPDSLIGEAKISLAARTGEKLDNRSRLDAVRLQEELIVREREQQDVKDKQDQEKDRLKEELEQKEVANTRVAANIQMKKETLKDMARPILTETEIEIRKQEVAEIMNIIAGLRDKKNPLLEEKEELRDVIETALSYQIKLEDEAVVETRRNQMLAKRVANMLNKSHKVLAQLEESLQNVEEHFSTEEEGVVLKKSEIQGAISNILNMDKKHKLLHIAEILSDPNDGTIKSSEVLKALEKIAIEGDLNAKEIAVVMKVMKTAAYKRQLHQDNKPDQEL